MKFPAKHLFTIAVAALAVSAAAQNAGTSVVIRAEAISGGRVEPTLFGNFMELLDDVVPGSWDDKKSFVIFAVNPTRDEIEFTPGFGGFDTNPRIVAASAVSDVLRRRQPDVENHWNEPERVKIVDLPTAGGAVMLPAFSAMAVECVGN